MHPTISYQLASVQIADLHRQADRNRAARAALQARRARRERGQNPTAARTPAVLARHTLALFGARGA